MDDKAKPFSLLTPKMQLEILRKMPNKELRRMRLTCSHLNSTIEENRQMLARRPKIGQELLFNVDSIKSKSKHKGFRVDKPGCEKKLSAFAISRLNIWLTRRYRGKAAKAINLSALTKVLEQLALSCDVAEIMCDPDQGIIIVQAMEHIEVREKIYVRSDGYDNERLLRNLNTSPKRAQISVNSKYYVPEDDLFAVIKNFRRFVSEEFTVEGFYNLLRDMRNSNDDFALQRVVCSFDDGFDNVPFETGLTETNPLPPMETLWHIFQLSQFEKRHTDKLAFCIRKMKLRSKCALIVERRYIEIDMDAVDDERIYIMRDDPVEILDFIIGKLDMKNFDENLKKEYLAASDDKKKMEILVRGYEAAQPNREFKMDSDGSDWESD